MLTRKLADVSDKGLYPVKFDYSDVDTGIKEYDMEMYVTKTFKVQNLGKTSQKVSMPALDSAMEEK